MNLTKLCFGLALLLLFACKGDTPTEPSPAAPAPPELVRKQIPVPEFSADSAYAHIASQVEFGPRIPESDAHAATRAYLQRTLARYGAEVTVQEFPAKLFTGQRVTGYNIIASFNPQQQKRVFLCAHYDTRPFADSKLSTDRRDEPIDGADDGGSGVGVLLEFARVFAANAFPDMGVDLVFFDLEDHGIPDGSTEEDSYTWGLGSQHWARQPHPPGYAPKFGILLDMVGAEGAVFGREQFSARFAGDYQNRIWSLAKKMKRGERFINANIGYAMDDHYFVNTIAGWPTVDIIYKQVGMGSTFGAHWHTHNDNLDIISKETLEDVGQVVTAVVYREAGNML